MLIVPGHCRSGPRAPAEIADEVEKYAREWGRTGSIQLVRAPGGFVCWAVTLSLRPNDKRLLAYQEGRAAEPTPEMVWLMDNETGRPLDIHQMGAAGVRQFLEKGNTFSGRGEYSSVLDALQKTAARNAEAREEFRQRMKEENRYERKQDKRKYLQIPQITPGIELNPQREP